MDGNQVLTLSLLTYLLCEVRQLRGFSWWGGIWIAIFSLVWIVVLGVIGKALGW